MRGVEREAWSGERSDASVFASRSTPSTLLHPGVDHTPDWNWDPGVTAALVGTLVLFGLGLRRRGFPRLGRMSWARVGAFLTGLAALVAAIISPLDQHAEQQFSLHMVQHMILIVIAAPLLIAARPGATLLLGLPLSFSRALGRVWRRLHGVQSRLRWLESPALAWVVHATTLWLWHIPGPFEAALKIRWVHDLEHITFLGTAMWFWWTIAQLIRSRSVKVGVAFFSLFTMALQSGLLGVLITFSRVPWYPTYVELAPLLHITALADQQLAGVIMWVPAGTIYFAAAIGILYRWLRDDSVVSWTSNPG